jgi:hypothetical protein
MAESFVAEIGDRLGGEGVENTVGEHVKILSPKHYQRVDNGVVSNPSIQDAIDNIAPKVKYRKTTVQHTITAADVTQEKSAFSDPIVMPSNYGNKTVAMVNLFGTIMTTDTSDVPNSFIIWVDYDSAHSSGSEVLSTNFITADDHQVNFSANIQLPFSTGSMHPSGLYLDIWRHGLPADSTISVTAEVTVLDRE